MSESKKLRPGVPTRALYNDTVSDWVLISVTGSSIILAMVLYMVSLYRGER